MTKRGEGPDRAKGWGNGADRTTYDGRAGPERARRAGPRHRVVLRPWLQYREPDRGAGNGRRKHVAYHHRHDGHADDYRADPQPTRPTGAHPSGARPDGGGTVRRADRKSTRLNSSH